MPKARVFFEKLQFGGGLLVEPYSSIGARVQELVDSESKVGIDALACSDLVSESFKAKTEQVKELSGASSPVSKLKIVKNDTEVSGLRKALVRESASLVSFYA